MIRDTFNKDWTFRNETPGREADTIPITLPHDAMHYEPRSKDEVNRGFTGYYPGGVYRYTKQLKALKEWENKLVLIEFEGVYHRSKVYLNGQLVGGRASGYALFHVDIGKHLKIGEENTIEVVADTSDTINTRWYSGSGIYRPVSLIVANKDHILPFGLKLTTISTKGLDRLVKLAVDVRRTAESGEMHVHLRIVGGNGFEKKYQFLVPSSVNEDGVAKVEEYLNLEGGELWSVDDPNLLDVHAVLKKGDETVDRAEDRFGIREIEADAERGFRINGERVLLRGGCIHHDNGVIGATTLEMADERRIRIMKEAGFNSIRSAHNPCSTAILRACDKYGVIVMDELTDVWNTPKMTKDYGRDFQEWWRRDAESMVDKNYNHPSVVFNSIGNEIEATAIPRGIALNKEMADFYKKLDPTRLTTNGINGFMNMIASGKDEIPAEGRDLDDMIGWLNLMLTVLEIALPYLIRLPRVDTRTRDAFAGLDTSGYNYMSQRYTGDIRKYPQRLIIGTETKHRDLVKIWPIVEREPQVLGDFVWTAMDYVGEAGIGGVFLDGAKPQIAHPWPAISAYTPIIDLVGAKQTAAYVSGIIWGLKKGPHLAVQPLNRIGRGKNFSSWRSTDSLQSWSWPGFEGAKAVVEVYADAKWVELLLDGKRVGWDWAGPSRDYLATFKVRYRPGKLEAVAYDDANNEIARSTLVSADPNQLKIRMQPEALTARANGADLIYVPIELVDDAGIIQVLSDRAVKLNVTGPVELLGFGSADYLWDKGLVDRESATHWGKALAVLRAGFAQGKVVITAEAEGCPASRAEVEVVAGSA